MTAKKRRKDDARPAEQHPDVKRFFARREADRQFYERHRATGGFAKWRGNRPKP